MELGIDVGATADGVSKVTSGLAGQFSIILMILVIGVVGRQVFVAFGPSLKMSNPLAGLSGIGMILVAFAIMVGGLMVMGKGRWALIQVQRQIVDPFVVDVLERDSCEVASGDYCVVVFEDGREIIVNWFDKRVDMFAIANPQTEVHWLTTRPQLRPMQNAFFDG